jgi:hypothetical protein
LHDVATQKATLEDENDALRRRRQDVTQKATPEDKGDARRRRTKEPERLSSRLDRLYDDDCDAATRKILSQAVIVQKNGKLSSPLLSSET